MNDLFPGLINDLIRRCEAICRDINSRDIHPDVDAYSKDLGNSLKLLIGKLTELLNDPDLVEEHVVADNFKLYKNYAQLAQIFESFPLPAILRYSAPDQLFYKMLNMISKEINYPYQVPLPSAFSSQHYWCHSPTNIIAIPAYEHSSLLGLPDLFHEVGHIIFFKNAEVFLGAFHSHLSEYIEKEKRRIDDESRPIPKEIYDILYVQWMDEWIKEFVSDMIATYLTGPAYGWCHIRLCSNMRDDPFAPGLGAISTHPADEARTRGVLELLQLMGLRQSASEIHKRWKGLESLSKKQKALGYELCYPDHLLGLLAANVKKACEQLGLTIYEENKKQNTVHIPKLLNIAWHKFLADSHSYPKWEDENIEELKNRLKWRNRSKRHPSFFHGLVASQSLNKYPDYLSIEDWMLLMLQKSF